METPVSEILPEIPLAKYPITVYQLGTHRSGIRHNKDDNEAINPGNCSLVGNALSIFIKYELAFEPGSNYKYSTWGYVLLSRVLEKVEGREYMSVMKEHVFEPAGMNSVIHATVDDKLISTFYKLPKSGKWEVSNSNPSCKWGGGGLLATPSELVQFNQSLINGKLIS